MILFFLSHLVWKWFGHRNSNVVLGFSVVCYQLSAVFLKQFLAVFKFTFPAWEIWLLFSRMPCLGHLLVPVASKWLHIVGPEPWKSRRYEFFPEAWVGEEMGASQSQEAFLAVITGAPVDIPKAWLWQPWWLIEGGNLHDRFHLCSIYSYNIFAILSLQHGWWFKHLFPIFGMVGGLTSSMASYIRRVKSKPKSGWSNFYTAENAQPKRSATNQPTHQKHRQKQKSQLKIRCHSSLVSAGLKLLNSQPLFPAARGGLAFPHWNSLDGFVNGSTPITNQPNDHP